MPFNMITNLVLIYAVAACYEGTWKKKLFVTLLIYGISVACDFMGVHILGNYSVDKTFLSRLSVFRFSGCCL